MEPVHKDLKTLLNDALELRNVNHEKLAQLTGISERYLWAIQNMEIDKLPPAPYVRGYIKKISEALQLNHDEIWELYKKELETNTSGIYDRLPENRFAIKHFSKETIILAALGVLLLFYLLTNLSRLTGAPDLVVLYPAESVTVVAENFITLTGTLSQKDKLTINGEEIFINRDGTFSAVHALQPGLNKIEFKAKRLLGKEKIIIKEVIYQPR